MKKVLLGTSALVGASMLAGGANAMPIQSYDEGGEPILTASIVMQFEAGIADNDDTKASGVFPAGRRDGRFVTGRFAEIWFQGEMTADNGLTYGARISLAADTPTRTNTYPGRKYMYFSGGWGSIEMGDWIGANSALSTTAIAKEVAGNGTWDHAYGDYFVVPGGLNSGRLDYIFANGHYMGWFDFGSKVTYFTPVLSGFQAGVSYSVSTDNVGNSLSNRGGVAGFPDTGAVFTNDGPLSSQGVPGSFHDAVGVGARWDGDFGPVGVGVSWVGLFARADSVNCAGAGAAAAACFASTTGQFGQREDMASWELGGKLTYAGFTLAMDYYDDGASGSYEGSNSDNEGVSAVLNYAFGPAVVGVAYQHRKNEHNVFDGVLGGATAEFEMNGYALSAGYTIATGLKWYADFLYSDFDGPTAATSAEGWTGYTGMFVSF